MQLLTKSIIVVIGMMIPMALGGCGGGGPAAGPSANPGLSLTNAPSSSRTVNVSGGGALQITLTTDGASYKRGAPVQIQLQAKNVGSVPVTYGSLGILSDAVITDAGGATVWQCSHAFGFAAGGGEFSLAPGATVTSTMPWDQRESLQVNPPFPYVPPGEYTITAWWQPSDVGATGFTPSGARAQFSPAPINVVIQDGLPPQQDQTPPAAPSGLNATVGNRGIGLGWTPGTGDVDYNVYRRTTNQVDGTPIASQVIGTTSLIIDGTPGITYYFVVRAIGGNGVEGPPSNEISVVAPEVSHTPPGSPGSADGPVISRR